MFNLQNKHKLGNSLQTLCNINEIRKSSYTGPIAVRGLYSGMKIQTPIDQKDLEIETEKYIELRGCRKFDIIYSEMAAPSMGIIRKFNAQLTRLKNGLHLVCST